MNTLQRLFRNLQPLSLNTCCVWDCRRETAVYNTSCFLFTPRSRLAAYHPTAVIVVHNNQFIIWVQNIKIRCTLLDITLHRGLKPRLWLQCPTQIVSHPTVSSPQSTKPTYRHITAVWRLIFIVRHNGAFWNLVRVKADKCLARCVKKGIFLSIKGYLDIHWIIMPYLDEVWKYREVWPGNRQLGSRSLWYSWERNHKSSKNNPNE